MTELAFDVDQLEQLEAMVELANGQMSDSIALLARWGADDDSIESAALVAVDRGGADLTILGEPTERALRLDFAQPMTDLHELAASMGGLLAMARQARSHEPITSLEELLDHDDDAMPLSLCTVESVEVLSPRLRAVGVSGLVGATSFGGDQSVALIIDVPGRPVPDDLDAAAYRAMSDDQRPKGSTYSVRRIDAEAGTATFWVVTHGDDPTTVSGWATTVAPGDRVAVMGPHEGIVSFGEVAAFVGVCDETAFAAVAATIDELPDGVEVTVVAEVEAPGHEVQLTERPGVEITWCHRSEATPDSPYALAAAVRERLTTARGDAFVMGAGESRCLTAVRRYLRHELGMEAGQVSLIPYWRRAEPG
ncbi:MAG: SIP domain-containing protein [Actinomycetota bacterium]